MFDSWLWASDTGVIEAVYGCEFGLFVVFGTWLCLFCSGEQGWVAVLTSGVERMGAVIHV